MTDDIQIRFFEFSSEGECVWEAYPDVNDLDVHHQVINVESVQVILSLCCSRILFDKRVIP